MTRCRRTSLVYTNGPASRVTSKSTSTSSGRSPRSTARSITWVAEPSPLVGLGANQTAELGISLGGIHQRQHHVAEATVVRRLGGADEARDQVVAQRTGVGDGRDDERARVHSLDDERLFAGEVPVDRGLGDSGPVGDLVDRRALDPYLGNEVGGSVEHGLADSLASRCRRFTHRYRIVAVLTVVTAGCDACPSRSNAVALSKMRRYGLVAFCKEDA